MKFLNTWNRVPTSITNGHFCTRKSASSTTEKEKKKKNLKNFSQRRGANPRAKKSKSGALKLCGENYSEGIYR